MPQRRKNFRDRMRDRSFLARRHAELLAEGPLHDEPYFARFQRRYRAAKSPEERYSVALELERLLHADPHRLRTRGLGGARRKSLVQLIRDGSFLARRHGDRLHAETLPQNAPRWADPARWRSLRELQAEYRRANDPEERWEIRLVFERIVPTVRFSDEQIDRVLSEL